MKQINIQSIEIQNQLTHSIHTIGTVKWSNLFTWVLNFVSPFIKFNCIRDVIFIGTPILCVECWQKGARNDENKRKLNELELNIHKLARR